jgi:hypothetical protein
VEEEEEFEIPEISLHAISGVPTPQTMRISGTIQGGRVILLADSASAQFSQYPIGGKVGPSTEQKQGI